MEMGIMHLAINVLPQVATTHREGWGDLTYMKSIASPLEQILGSNAPIMGLYISPYYLQILIKSP